MKKIFLLLLIIPFWSCKKDSTPELFSIQTLVNPEEAGFISPELDTLLEVGEQVSLQAVPNEGFVFSAWVSPDSASDNPLMLTITEDVVVVANFIKKSYPLNIDITGEGEVVESVIQSKDYDHGTLVQLEAIADTGWVFKSWSGDYEGTEPIVNIEIESDMRIVANFEIQTFQVTISVTGNGYVDSNGQNLNSEIEYGTTLMLDAISDTMWVFKEWTGDLIDSSPQQLIEVTEALNLTAGFEEGELDYCVPKSVDAFRYKSLTDSVKIMDWDFIYDGRFISSYESRIDYTKTREYDPTYQIGTLEYVAGNISILEKKTVVSNVKDIYEFTWQGNFLTNLKYFYRGNISYDQESTAIEYNSSCGLALHAGEEVWGEDLSTFEIEYIYTNRCNTYRVNLSDFEITFSNESSIYKDVKGIPGFLGGNYENFILDIGSTLLPNENNHRLEQQVVGVPVLSIDNGLVTENYQYFDYIQGVDYPRYFIRNSTYEKTTRTDKDSFVVDYYCGYKLKSD